MSKRPNVLFIVSDQHNARCLSCEDHPEVKTPNLDGLAAEGVRFTNAYCQSPVCTPSRMSFLTGLYPSTTGFYGLYGRPPQESLTSIFHWYQSQGYRTGAVGKLHTPRYWIEAACDYVYDEFREYPTYLEALGIYEKNDSRGFVAGKALYSGEPSAIPLEHSPEAVVAKHAGRFIRNEGEPKDRGATDEPWCLWVSFSRPHEPCNPSEPYFSMYQPQDVTLPPTGEGNIGAKQLEEHHHGNQMSEGELRRWLASYLGMVSQVDDGVGRVLSHLNAAGQASNTIVVYFSDHGDYAGEQGRMEKNGGISHRAITRVPLIVRLGSDVTRTHEARSVAVGGKAPGIVELVDVFPTLCSVSGISPPATVQGRDFSKLLFQPDVSFRESALTENPHRKALATPELRFVANLIDEDESDELYFREDDPWENVNLSGRQEVQAVEGRATRLLLNRVVEARRPVTSMNGHWHGHVYDEDGRLDRKRAGARTAYW